MSYSFLLVISIAFKDQVLLRYTREVAWYVQATPVRKRRYVASQLMSRLTGPARLLAMSWRGLQLDAPSGTRTLLHRLATSPLVRKSLPNAAAICAQYFSFRRQPQEGIGNFLVRETLVHEEFTEALIRLHEEKCGVSQALRDFGLPEESLEAWDWDDDSWTDGGWRWWEREDDDYDIDQRDPPVGGDAEVQREDPPGDFPEDRGGPVEAASPGRGPRGATGSSPSNRGGETTTPAPKATSTTGLAGEALDELSLADSFILGVLRGWRLLQAAGLTAEEKRDILSSTKNSLDYETIAAALQNLWDDQLLGQRHRHLAEHQAHYVEHQDVFNANYQDEWWQPEGSGWYDGYHIDGGYGDYGDGGWWYDEWNGDYDAQQAEAAVDPGESDEQVKDAQKAEAIAENLAMEANRTWTEAQRATQALRRDRGFGAVTLGKGGKHPGATKCFVCGGPHMARDCPDRRHPSSKGMKGKYGSYAMDMDDDYAYGYYIGKGKGGTKGKGKRAMWMDSQAWMKGKGKHRSGKNNSKDTNRSVNAYMTDYFIGGLEVSDTMELNSASANPEADTSRVGMLDCGATASAAPEAVVQGLISAVLSKDKTARIELDQSARPYFRFGNGRWGRAVCRTHIHSNVSGNPLQFSLYTLPNPAEYYESHYASTSLVPVLIGMDFLGKDGVGMMIDFATGLAMMTKEPQPRIFQLEANRKGHYTLDIVQYLTKGQTCHEGQAHVIVRNASQPTTAGHHHMLELATVWFDMAHGERDPHEHELEVSRDRMWQLYWHSRNSAPSTAVTAQMCGAIHAQLSPTTSSTRTNGLRCADGPDDRPGGRGDPCSSVESQDGQGQTQEPAKILRPDSEGQGGSKGSTYQDHPVAMLQQAHSGHTPVERLGPMGEVSMLQPQDALHAPQGSAGQLHGEPQPPDREEDAGRPACSPGEHSSHCPGVPLHDAEADGRGGLEQGGVRAPVRSGTNEPHNSDNDGTGFFIHPSTDNSDERVMGGSSGRGADSGLRERSGRLLRPAGVDANGLPLYMGKKVMAMVALMTTATTSLLTEAHLHGRDGVWEIACAPHSWLSQACEEHHLKPRRINLASGYDLYDASTWSRLTDLRRQHKPQRMWFSLPCTKWSQWSSVNYNTEEKRNKLETSRRRERRMLWFVNKFLKETLDEDPDVEIYYEWPWPCTGWRQQPLVDLSEDLHRRGLPWLDCRIDGCNYGMRNEATGQFVRKRWLVKTTDERFHRVFKAKICPGNHGQHCTLEGLETTKSAYYPWKMVQSIARHWQQQLVPERHLQLLEHKVDQPAAREEFLQMMDENAATSVLEEFQDDHLLSETDLEVFSLLSNSSEAMAREARVAKDYSYQTMENVMMEVHRNLQPLASNNRRWGNSDTTRLLLGGYSHGAFAGLTKNTQRHQELTHYINDYLAHHVPHHAWTSLMVSFNCGTTVHQDHHNLTGSQNVLHCLGNFDHGGLWLQGTPPDGFEATRRRLVDGNYSNGYVVNARYRFVTFDPKIPHATQAWRGFRIAISSYTTRLLPQMTMEDKVQLRRHGFRLTSSTTTLSMNQAVMMPVEANPLGGQDDDQSVSNEERERWQAQVAKLHKAAGHPTNRNLAKIVKDAGHPAWKVRVALEHQCPACQSLRQGGTSSKQIPPAATHTMYGAWEAVGIDVGEWIPPKSKVKIKFVLFMDMATKLRVLQPLYSYGFLEMRTETANDVIKAFSERWIGNFPKPRLLIMDAAKTFSSETMHEFANDLNIQLSFVAEKEAWSHGVVEAGIQDVKMTASAIHLEALDQDPFITMYLATSALNSTEYTAGYSAFQWAYGREYSLTDEDVRTMSAADYKDEFVKLVSARERAEAVAIRTRAQRVLSKLSNTSVRQPLRTYKPMDLVKVWRRVWPKEQFQGPRGGLRKSGKPHWIGPGRVVFNEVLPHQEADDERRHIVWVLIGSQLFRCSAHSVRPVTPTEQFTFETSGEEQPSQWRSLADVLPKREYQDLTDQIPDVTEVEEPPLPALPDPTTMTTPTRRLVKKTALKEKSRTTTPSQQTIPGTSSTTTAAPFPQMVPETSSTTTVTPHQQTAVDSSGGDPTAVNDYAPIDPEPKRPRLKENWVQDLYKAEQETAPNLDIFSAFQECTEFLKVEMDLDEIKSNRQRKAFERNPVLYLVKKMKDAEVSLARLPAHEKVLFERAKMKEVDSFLKNEAVRRCLDRQEIRKAYESKRIVRARWVLTWKLTPTEEREEAQQDRATNVKTVYNRDATKKAKARIVLLGFEHPNLLDPTFKTASPVQSTVGRNLLYALAVQHQWPIEGLDLATAFLQTQATEADQEIWTYGVKELREALGIGEEGIMRILRNIYGSTTAPRGLWLDLHKTLTKLGAQPVLGERCLWIFLSKRDMDGDHPRLLGAMGGHVDDFHRVGDGSAEWLEIRDAINRAYKWGMTKVRNYRHAGTDVSTVTDQRGLMKIVVNQDYYAEGLPDIDIPPDRLRSDVPLERKDVDACRTSLGALQWLAIQSQPHLCARCNLLLTDLVTNGTMMVAREVQELVAEARREPFSLVFEKFTDAKHWSDIIVITMGDQAHANRPKGDSTGGLVTMLAGPNSASGAVCPMSLIAWRTWKLKRKAIGSNDAEVQAMLEAEDQNFRTRQLWAKMHGAGGRDSERALRRDWVETQERMAIRVKGILCTDSKGGYDAVELNESPLLGLSNMRAALQAFQLRDNLRRTAAELRWVASDFDLGDALTKKRSDCRTGLLKFLRTQRWCIRYDPQFISAKKNKQAGRSAVDHVDRALGQMHEQLTSFCGWCNMYGSECICDSCLIQPQLFDAV
ncbi:Copia protein [Symbiodinium microadriaticum]|uniref:Copia protein n=1 Tax=Symbiodinium microadriaticum TaxID=2951 RepID=A0A1Q9DGM6_SYMMI|nr:Copia protein [Symbiodinium microadriaticum]